MPNRRRFLQLVSSLPWLGSLLGAQALAAAPPKRDFFRELGVRPVINAAGTYTALTGSLMLPEVVEAMRYAAGQYVALNDLHDAVGRRIASLIGCEAVMVTAGAASALTLGTAAVLTGKNRSFIEQIPDLSGMKSEVIIQRSHRFSYDHAVRNCGVKMVEVETREDLEHAINPETALMLFLNDANDRGQIKDEEWVQLGRRHGITTFNDCAADVPPVENLSKYVQMGFDLVTFSGGKGLRGPQSAGLLLGSTDLIEAARLNSVPNSNTIGRGMKVNKEELVGMMVAVELYLKKDHKKEWKEWEERASHISKAVTSVKGVSAQIYVPPIANNVPHIRVRWDPSRVRLTAAEAAKKLKEGNPSVAVIQNGDALQVGVWMLESNEHKIVASRLKDVLSGKS